MLSDLILLPKIKRATVNNSKNRLKKQKNKVVYNFMENIRTQSQIKTARKLKAKDVLAATEETEVSPPPINNKVFLIIFGKTAKLRMAEVATRTAATADLYKTLLIPPSEK